MRPNFYCKKNISLFFLFLIALLTACSLQLNATVRFVSKTGSSVPPFLTWETASDSIQKCINICVFGDTIYVANGVYEEQVVMIPGLALIGAGMDSCVIDTRSLIAAWDDISVEVKDPCWVKGFKIIVSNNPGSGIGWGIAGSGDSNSSVELNRITSASIGIFLDATFFPIVNISVNKNICDNVGIGVEMFNSNSIVKGNFIYTGNFNAISEKGIGIGAFSNNYHPIIDSNYIETISEGIRKSINSRPTITNNTIVLKRLEYATGIFLSSSDSAKVYNNLIISEGGWQGIRNNGTPYLILNNNYITGEFYDYQNNDCAMCITSFNSVKNNNVTKVRQGVFTSGTQNLIYQFNNIWHTEIGYIGFTPDTTNISVEPMIVNDDTTQGKLDFHLQKYSPLIDAGDPTILDRDGTISDIGLYGGPYGESYLYIDLPPRIPVNLTANVDSLIKLNWNRNTEADFSYYNVYRDTTFNFTVDSTKLIASVTDTFYYQSFPSNVETLYYKLTAVDNQGNESNPSEQVYVLLVSVKNEWAPVNNYILYQNYPNPFNPSTKIGYKLKDRGYVKLYVYDIKGELVSVLINQVQESGYYEIEFSATNNQHLESSIKNLASGVYIYQIFVSNDNRIPVFSDVKKMIYVK
jgi:hypothetical protein